ncbi:hypothetical protein, partial [Kurthia zopfii]|uniref:hypothetical protein n=1 Tax=Kurthia zopfii TaxID=1650 RepID=UPI001AAC4BF8
LSSSGGLSLGVTSKTRTKVVVRLLSFRFLQCSREKRATSAFRFLSSSKRYMLWDTSGFREKVVELLLSLQTLQYPRIWASVLRFSFFV